MSMIRRKANRRKPIMITKTITVQLHKPSRTKSSLLLLTMKRYAQALQFLLNRCRPAVEDIHSRGQIPSQFALIKLLDKDALASLNEFEMQPFKDSLKLDFAMLVSSYLSLSQTRKTSYPLVYTGDDEIKEIFTNAAPSLSKASAALSKYQSPRTLLFGRYDTRRDFCLLRDELSGRYYAKIYLLPAASSLRRTYEESRRLALKYVSENPAYLETRKQRERYLVFPIACGRKQADFLDEAAKDPACFRTARLYCRGGKFYLAVSISLTVPAEQKPQSLLGLARGYDCPLHISLTDFDDSLPQSFRLGQPPESCDDTSRLHIWANEVIRIARENNSQILYEGLARRTDFLRASKPAGRNKAASLVSHGKIASLSIPQYKQLCSILPYKAAQAGLPKPISISSTRLYQTCPACGHCSGSNRFLPGLMICTKCGFSADSNIVGSINLIRRFENYSSQRVVFTCSPAEHGTWIENTALDIKFLVRSSFRMEEDFCAQLENYLAETAPRDKPFPYDPSMGRQKYGLLWKLRAANPLSQAVEIVGLPCRNTGLLSQYFSESEP